MSFMIDSHCHLEHPRFEGELKGVVKRARAAGVGLAVTAGSNLANNRRALELSGLYPGFVKCVIGLSPHNAGEDLEENLGFLRANIKANKNKITGIGEIGLDYHYFKKSWERERQGKVFEAQLVLAEELGLPVVIHSREAEEDVFQALSGFGGRVVMHCFMKPKWVPECVKRNYLVSVPTVKCAARVKTIKTTPLELLLCETDSPFLWRGRNEPANVKEVYGEVARVKGMDFNKVVEQVYSNAAGVFR